MTKYCITKDNAILKVKSVADRLVNVSDPDAVDAGMYISTDDVLIYFQGFRVKEKLPDNGNIVSVVTGGMLQLSTLFDSGRFWYDLLCEEDVSTAGIGVPDKVILWRERETVY